MRKISIGNKILFFITIVLNILLIISIVFLMAHAQNLLNSDVEINLTEVVKQNRDVISSKISVEVNSLNSQAEKIAERMRNESVIDDDCLKRHLVQFSNDINDNNLYIASESGAAYFPSGDVVDIHARQYFKLAMNGMQNISMRILSRVDGSDIFVISVPLELHDKIVGTIQKSYTPQEMYDICSISLFSEQGFMHIVNSDGYILVSSLNNEYSQEGSNFFRDIYSQGNKEESDRLKEDISNNKDGFLEIVLDGEKIFSAYTQVIGIPDWYLISSISKQAISPNASNVIEMFYAILMVVAVIFAVSLFYFFFNKNKQHAKLEKIAFVDMVTGGNTYNKFLTEIKGILSKFPDKSFAILSFDIDNFKFINSAYGFDEGDAVLKKIYADFSAKLNDGELAARISSDRFVALLNNFSEARLENLLTFEGFNNNISIFISAGLYIIGDINGNVNLMIDKASTAAQSIKGAIEKKVAVYTEKFNSDIERREQMKRKIKSALACGEIQPYFQPKVDINTGELIGAEALARWVTKDGKVVSPAEFIPLCEKIGQIVEVDNCIFGQVLKFLSDKLQSGAKCVPISVNFSRVHLAHEDFVHMISETIQKYFIPPKLVQIELTESVFFENNEVITDFANHLHEHGLCICIDDFGSGYSSLNMLKDIPVDVLKIDKAFLDNTKNVERQNVILSLIVQMAKKLNMEVVVEGVETKENVELMRSVGCNIAQGYYFARPMNMNEFDVVFCEGRI